jgi:hypothetical protein
MPQKLLLSLEWSNLIFFSYPDTYILLQESRLRIWTGIIESQQNYRKLSSLWNILEYTCECIKLKKGKKLMKKFTESKFNFSSKSNIKNKFIILVAHTVENFHVNALFL